MNTKDEIGKLVNAIHRTLFNASKGRVAGKLLGMPVLMLSTTGRKSGKKRSSMLTSPLEINGNRVIVASWGGDDRHPLWYLNLKSNPDVEVTMKGATKPMRARVLEGAERESAWTKVSGDFKNYAGYQTKTSRVIPLVVLEPR